MRKIGFFLGKLSDVTAVSAGIAVIAMMIQVVVDVFARTVLGLAIPGTIAIVSHYYMVMVAFIPLAFAEVRDQHISVEVITEHLSKRMQFVLEVFAQALGVVVYGLLSYASLQEALSKMKINSFVIEQSLRLILWPAYFIVPIGSGLICIVLLYKVVAAITGTGNHLGYTKPKAEF